ncbi:hypothetical protein DINM_002784 [Dirofilaria immitis]|nr:hypothetical protein [Dirofilaria immitis]
MLFTVLGWFMAFWSVINLLDYFLRVFHVPIYVTFVKRYELIVMLFQIRFVPFQSLGTLLEAFVQNSFLSYLLTIWFTIGIISAMLCSFGIILYLSRSSVIEITSWWFETSILFASYGSVMNVYQVEAEKKFIEENEGLKFVIPGWNIPWSQVPLYIGILLIAAVVHEMGHMLAALNTNVPVTNMSFILFALCLGAYVEVDATAVRRLSPLQKLRISCAGVWHNLVLALFAWMLYESTSFIVSPLYSKDSPLSGANGLHKATVVRAINDCNVTNVNDWKRCMKIMKYTNLGFCVPDDVIAKNIANEMKLVENELDCCQNSTWNNSASHMCFYNLAKEQNHELLEYFSAKICACLSARYVAELKSCSSTENCIVINQTLATPHSSCVFPALLGNMSFMRISTENTSRLVLYVGYIKELEFDLQMSSYVPRLPIFSTLLPYFIELFAKYLFTFSFAFAVINAMPCIYLDGQYICFNFVDFIFSKLRSRRRRLVKRISLIYGTILLAINFTIAVWKLYKHTV